PDRFAKAAESGADVVVLDLEDAVHEDDKGRARGNAVDWLADGNQACVRINGAATSWFDDDLPALAPLGDGRLIAVMLPKAESRGDVDRVAAHLPEPVAICPLIETALGVLRADEVAAASRGTRLVFGSLDLMADLGTGGEGIELLHSRSQVVVASRALGLPAPVDGVTTALGDQARLAKDVRTARGLGFGGKLCIHPDQVEAVNRGMMPAADELRWARRVLAAAGGGGAVALDGEMIDRPRIERARAIVARADGAGA
ncbi:MAG: CoA ester lyase, partial [Thermoleophilaceae bacterium]